MTTTGDTASAILFGSILERELGITDSIKLASNENPHGPSPRAMDAVLRSDPTGEYSRMTFATRDQYRHVVEAIASRTRMDEATIAYEAIALARRGARLIEQALSNALYGAR